MNSNRSNSDKNEPAPLKVLFITHNYIRNTRDFAGVFLHLLARKLREHNIEVHVVAPHDAGCETEEEIQGIKVYRFRYADDDKETFAYRGDMHRQLMSNPLKILTLRKFLKASLKLAEKVIENEHISIISVHWVVPNGWVAKKLKSKYKDKIKILLSSHGTDVRILTKKSYVYPFFKSAIKKSDGWTVVSNFLKNLVMTKDSAAAKKIQIVPLPNDDSIFYPDDNILEDPNLVVAVSRLTIQKRIDFLLKSIKAVAAVRPSVKLEIYGKGPERENFLKLIKELDLTSRVKICDPVEHRELRNVYNRAALVVLNSIDEGFGLVLTEAMLCRTAVIGAKSGGITDIIDNQKTGLLVNVDDVEHLAGRIKLLLEDTSFRLRLAEAGYRKALDKFSARSSAQTYAELFRTLCNKE